MCLPFKFFAPIWKRFNYSQVFSRLSASDRHNGGVIRNTVKFMFDSTSINDP